MNFKDGSWQNGTEIDHTLPISSLSAGELSGSALSERYNTKGGQVDSYKP